MISNSQIASPFDIVADSDFEDSIANICWYTSEPSPLLAVSSWDSKIRIYKPPQPDLSPTLEEIRSHTTSFPAISLAWMDHESLTFGTIDGQVIVMKMGSEMNEMLIGKHDDAVKGVFYLPEHRQLICSVSYDKTLKLWDTREGNSREVLSIDLEAKPISCDLNYPYMLIGLDSKKFYRFRVDQMIESHDVGRAFESGLIQPMAMQLTSASISQDRTIAFGSDNGRSLVAWLANYDLDNTIPHRRGYNFRAHQTTLKENDQTIYLGYPVNAVGLHPKNKATHFTAGRDGYIRFWDNQGQKPLTAFSCHGVPVTEAKWSPDGKFLAYGVGYDWSIGIEGAKSFRTKLYVHTVQPNELAPERAPDSQE